MLLAASLQKLQVRSSSGLSAWAHPGEGNGIFLLGIDGWTDTHTHTISHLPPSFPKGLPAGPTCPNAAPLALPKRNKGPGQQLQLCRHTVSMQLYSSATIAPGHNPQAPGTHPWGAEQSCSINWSCRTRCAGIHGQTKDRLTAGSSQGKGEKALHWRFLAARGLSHCPTSSTQGAADPCLPLVGASRGQWEVWCLPGARGSM